MESEESKNGSYDAVIVGGGITGAAVFYMLSRYTDLKRILLLEKYSELAHVNSHFQNNSQTLHFGDTETNYPREKAEKVKAASEMVRRYVDKHDQNGNLFNKTYRMALAVGEEEVEELSRRYDDIKDLYPELKKIGRKEIGEVEPIIVKERPGEEKLLALLSPKGYAVNYHNLSKSLAEEAKRSNPQSELKLGVKVMKITKKPEGYELETSAEKYLARFVVFAAGAHSLIFAQSMGYGQELGILPVAGSFYNGYNLLHGKVYTMQIKKLPFAAIHGDPNVHDPCQTRFGPTAKVVPVLERHNYSTTGDFLKTSAFTWDGIWSLIKIMSDPIIFKFIGKNLLYDLPYFGKRIFMKNIQKIIPSIKLNQFEYAPYVGGLRPQVVNTEKKKMEMGEVKILGERVIFDITPSPGASVCLGNAKEDMEIVAAALGAEIYKDKLEEELL